MFCRGRLADCTPVVVYGDGRLDPEGVGWLRLQPQDVMAAACQQGYERLKQVKWAVVERNGGIPVVGKNE